MLEETREGTVGAWIIFSSSSSTALTLGSIYGLIAIGYTMVYGIIGMVNFAHGDVFMLSAFIALILFMILTQILHLGSLPIAFIVVLIGAMALTGLWNWAIERLAYRPLARVFPPRAADLGDRHVDLPVELRSGRAGAAQQAGAAIAQPRLQYHGRTGRRQGRLFGDAVDPPDPDHGRDRGAARRLLVSRPAHVARPRPARLRAGPQDGGAARHRCRRDDLDHLHHRRGAGGGRGRDVRHLLRGRQFRRRVRARA